MKKLVLALTAVAAMTVSASAADLAARPYAKAPAPVMVAPSWTGFYIFGGAGGGIWDADTNTVTTPGGVAISRDQRMGGDGWFGTVGAGYDWQFNGSWVAGIFAETPPNRNCWSASLLGTDWARRASTLHSPRTCAA